MIADQLDPELALAEIKHRLSNSLQLINSLVQIRMRTATSDEARDALRWVGSVVAALGRLHDGLSAAGVGGFAQFLHESVQFWNGLGSARGVTVSLSASGDLTLAAAKGPSLALVIHELVSNAMEHAFGRDGEGQINISVVKQGARIDIVVEDDGSGFDVDQDQTGSLGLGLVRRLVNQMGGSLDIATDRGTKVRISLPQLG
jgi:two-component sensor histidine kinase